jgi:hypothetical protein
MRQRRRMLPKIDVLEPREAPTTIVAVPPSPEPQIPPIVPISPAPPSPAPGVPVAPQ